MYRFMDISVDLFKEVSSEIYNRQLELLIEVKMKVSIIIPNYNGMKYIKNCMDSLYIQLFKKFEIIIVDNNSIDGSYQFILDNYTQVKLIHLKENYGFSKAVNEGIKAATGEYVVLLNNDTDAKEDWLENLLNCIEKDEKIFSCSSKMIRYNEKDKIDDAGDQYSILGWAHKSGDGDNINKYCKDRQVFSSCAGAAIYRRKVFNEIGYFDENFFAYLEDVDISYRSRIHGYKNVYCSNAEVYHIGSGTSGSRHNSFKVKLAVRNNIYLIYKNMPLLQLLINSPLLFIGWIIKLVFFVKKGYVKEYISGTLGALRTLKNIKKVKFISKNSLNYIKIEFQLILNLFIR